MGMIMGPPGDYQVQEMRLSPPMANSIDEAAAHMDFRRSSLSEPGQRELYTLFLNESRGIALFPGAIVAYMSARGHSVSSSDISFYRMAFELDGHNVY